MTARGGRSGAKSSTPARGVSEAEFRAAILELGPGASNAAIGARLDVHPDSIRRYRRRFGDVERDAPMRRGPAPLPARTCPPGHVLFGFDDAGRVVSCPPCSVVLFGRPGSGKSTTAANLAEQFGRLGAELLVGDPHAGAADSLSARLGLDPDHVPDEPESIALLVAAAHDELADRKRARRNDGPPLLLVLDEWLLAAWGQPAMREQLRVILAAGRKFGVYAALVSQLVTGRDLPTWLRHPAGAVVLHAVHGSSAWHALGVSKRELPREPALLEPGRAYVRLPNLGEIALVRVRDPGELPRRSASPLQLVALELASAPPPAPVRIVSRCDVCGERWADCSCCESCGAAWGECDCDDDARNGIVRRAPWRPFMPTLTGKLPARLLTAPAPSSRPPDVRELVRFEWDVHAHVGAGYVVIWPTGVRVELLMGCPYRAADRYPDHPDAYDHAWAPNHGRTEALDLPPGSWYASGHGAVVPVPLAAPRPALLAGTQR